MRLGTFNFSDALVRYGAKLTVEELEEAYRRAGAAFKGQLQQNFVVLTEQREGGAMRGRPEAVASGGVNGSPRKRFREVGPSGSRSDPSENKPKVVKKD